MVIKDETKFLYIKKKKLSRDPHCTYLHATKEWGKLQHVTDYDINPKLNHKLEKKYHATDKKTQ
jgi:hypothetical protein